MFRAKFRSYLKRSTKYLKIGIGTLVISIISYTIIKPPLKIFSGPEKYTIYIVSDHGDEASRDIRNACLKGINELNLEIDGVEIKTIIIDDQGDPDKAEACARRIVGRNDTLMVVGHFYSDQTEAALPIYLGADPQIPVILTTETNPQLIPPARSGEYDPVYGLSPDDNNQAKIAAQLAAQLATDRDKKNNFWVVQDHQKKIYSNFLANKFIEETQARENTKVLLLSDSNLTPSVETLKALNIDCVFFAGLWHNALILVDQIYEIYESDPNRPKIILTDMCVDRRLIPAGKDAVKGVYLTHQLEANQYLREGGWKYYGDEAVKTIVDIVEEAKSSFNKGWIKKWLGIRRAGDVRKAIKEVMNKKYGEKQRVETSFKIWKIECIKESKDVNVYEFTDWKGK
ncbi:MAG: ABC transporter substrate-binding protein [Planctomycetota bacterium]|jgi:branched-chain amino acid transport system substrate-binding protein